MSAPATRNPMRPLHVVAVQHAAGRDVEANLAGLARLLPEPDTADLVVLPEVFAGRGTRADLRCAAGPAGGAAARWLAQEAVRRRCWLLGGVVEQEADRCFNTAMLVDRQGQVRAAYRKIHLFDAVLPDGRVVNESGTYTAGEAPCLADVEGWRCGLSVCYDLRFPELYRHYQAGGARLLLAPADFTDATGRAHWEVLVRARAIENQCFVVAPNQCGVNAGTGVASYGHSLIVDPWGRILVQAGDEPATLTATLDPGACEAVRDALPAWRHRRL